MDISRNEAIQIEKQKHYYYFDVLRLISCLAVIMIHISAEYAQVRDIGKYWVAMIPNGISRFATGMFLMISGALFLNEDKNVTFKKMRKHIFKLIIFFIFWSLLYSSIYNLIIPSWNGQPINVRQFLRTFIEGRYHLWFIYVIIGLYLITPLLRLWLKRENKKYVIYFLILSYVFGQLLPLINNLFGLYKISQFVIDIILSMSISYVSGCIIFFVLGYYLFTFDVKYKKSLYIFGLVCILSAIIGNYFISVSLNQVHTDLYYESDALTFFYSSAVFVFFKNLKLKPNKYVTSISKLTLGVYGIHDILMTMYQTYLPQSLSKNVWFGITIIFLLISLTAFLITFIVKKIPLLRKVV